MVMNEKWKRIGVMFFFLLIKVRRGVGWGRVVIMVVKHEPLTHWSLFSRLGRLANMTRVRRTHARPPTHLDDGRGLLINDDRTPLHYCLATYNTSNDPPVSLVESALQLQFTQCRDALYKCALMQVYIETSITR